MEAKKLYGFPAGISICVLFSLFLFPPIIYLLPQPFASLDTKIYDYKLKLRGTTEADPRVVHLDIDDRSVKQYGMWPWDRRLSAEMVTRLQALGAAVIVFDIFFPGPGKSSEGDEAFFESIARSGLVVSATALDITHSGNPGDKVLVEDEKYQAVYTKAWPVTVPPEMNLWWVNELPDSFVPLVPIVKVSREIGHIVSTPDRDGVHRRIPLLIKLSDRCVPSLSLAALVAYLKSDSSMVEIKKSGFITVKYSGGKLDIPVDPEGNMLVNWPDRKECFSQYSAASLLSKDHEISLVDAFKNKVVVVAYSATGTTDMGVNPLFSSFLLSRIHSCSISTMLTNRFIRTVQSFPVVVPVAAVAALLFGALCTVIRHRYAVMVEIVCCAMYALVVFASFKYLSWEIPIAAPLLLFSVSATATLVSRAISMESQADRVSQALERYLSPQMLQSIIEQDHEIDLSTRRKELSILFVDIRGFSKISETVEEEHLERFLNDFLEAMTRSVFDNHGTVDKFLGDGLMAFFGDPLELENHALAAIGAAQQMQREMIPLNARWSKAGIQELSKGVHIRVGINTGMVVVGNIGSRRRMEYTVIGSAVNVASRLQEVASADGILISARTYDLTGGHVTCKEPRMIRVKGADREITVYEIESVEEAVSL